MRRLAIAALVAVAAGCGGSTKDVAPPTAWRTAPTPPLAGTGLLTGVSCVSESFCFAVGSRLRRLVSHTLVERWDGRSWTVVPTSEPDDRRSTLAGVSCASRSFCVAVGSHFTDAGGHALIEAWNGRAWHVVGSGDPSLTNVLSSVACSSPRFCVAVGTTRGSRPRPFAETWRGNGWTVTPVPGYPGPTSLSSVWCLSGPFCVAVGQPSSGARVLPQA